MTTTAGATKPLPDARPAQVWADNDRRSKGRTMRIIEVNEQHNTRTGLTEPVALVEILTNTDETTLMLTGKRHNYGAKDMRGKRTTIAVHRFVPNSTGYRLVSVPNEATSGTGVR